MKFVSSNRAAKEDRKMLLNPDIDPEFFFLLFLSLQSPSYDLNGLILIRPTQCLHSHCSAHQLIIQAPNSFSDTDAGVHSVLE